MSNMSLGMRVLLLESLDDYINRSDGAINEWVEQLWSTLLSLHPLPDGKQIIDDFVL